MSDQHRDIMEYRLIATWSSRKEASFGAPLLSSGAQLEIHAACALGKTREVEKMLTANPNLAKDRDPCRHQTPLFWAAERGRRELVELLIRHGADVNARAPDRSRSTKGDQTGKTPLHVAAEGGHTAVIQTLLEKGANIDATDEVPFTPLHWAIRHERDDAVKLLLEKGATVDLDDTDGGCLRFARENPVITESTPFASASVVTPSHQMAVIGG